MQWSVVLSLALAQSGALAGAPTPPMGWNGYDAYGTTIDETQFRANVRWMSRNLKPPDAIVTLDSHGRYLPAPNRFPSAANGAGFAPLAAYVHSLGLGFGIHILRGIPREAVKNQLPIANSDFGAGDAVR